MKLKRFLSLNTAVLLALAVAVSACGKKNKYTEEEPEEGGAAAASGGNKIDPATAGTVSGTIVFDGAAPAPIVTDVSADAVCSTNPVTDPALTQEVAVKDGKLANVFVYVSKGLDGTFDPPAEAVTLDQKGCRYHPHVLGMVAGQKIKIINSDATLHNVHPTPKNNPAFNLAQPTAGKVDEKSFDKEEVMVPVSCDVHGWMHSYIGVLNHPAFDVSKEDGKFTFKAPPGTYTITAWHEKLGKQDQQVTIGKGETKDVTFTFKAQ
jgi:hypothetical protein